MKIWKICPYPKNRAWQSNTRGWLLTEESELFLCVAGVGDPPLAIDEDVGVLVASVLVPNGVVPFGEDHTVGVNEC